MKKRDNGKIKRRTALFLSATIMIGTMGSLAACGKGSDKDSVRDGSERPVNTIAEVSTGEKLYVTVADDGTLIDSSTGRQLTSEEVEKLVEEGVVEITEDGKAVITIAPGETASTVVIDVTAEDVTEGTSSTTRNTTTESTTSTTTESTTRSSTTERTSEVTTRATTEVTTESTTEVTTRSTTRESTTEATTRATTRETTTESTTESTTEATTRATTRETTTESTTESTTEATTVHQHKWIWKTHTETIHHDAVTHEEPVYDEGWTEYIYVEKYHCGVCGNFYDSWDDYLNNDHCHGSWGTQKVLVDTIEHEPEILYYDTITDIPAWDEYIEVKDYQYCSECGAKK